MKIYIAARFSRRPEANRLAHILKAQGHVITSRWVLPETDHVIETGLSRQAADSERRRFAMEDIDDVIACDWMISLMEEPRSNTRGGRHIEFGMAVALGKRLTIIGPRETVFHHIDAVEHYETTEQLTAALSGASDVHDFGEAIDPNASHNRRARKAVPPIKYRKTALIEATQWFKMGDHPAVSMKDDVTWETMQSGEAVPWLHTLEGGNIVQVGDWIATGVKGEHWCIKPDVFAETYEPALKERPGSTVLEERHRCIEIVHQHERYESGDFKVCKSIVREIAIVG